MLDRTWLVVWTAFRVLMTGTVLFIWYVMWDMLHTMEEINGMFERMIERLR